MALDDRLTARTFNKYFGSGMSALVFQEIREFRSLAYSAYGIFQIPWYLNGKDIFEVSLVRKRIKPWMLSVLT